MPNPPPDFARSLARKDQPFVQTFDFGACCYLCGYTLPTDAPRTVYLGRFFCLTATSMPGLPCVSVFRAIHKIAHVTCDCNDPKKEVCAHATEGTPCGCACHLGIEGRRDVPELRLNVPAREPTPPVAFPRVAWLALDTHDDEGKSVIVFSPSDRAGVLQQAANHLERESFDTGEEGSDEAVFDTEGIELERKPHFDRYAAQGFVPTHDLLADGWWFECEGCGKSVTQDDDFEVVGRDRPGHRAAVFHNAICAARHAAKTRAERWKEQTEVQRARQRFPDAIKIRSFRNDHGTVELTLPGKVNPVIEMLGPPVTCAANHPMHAVAVYDDHEAAFQPALRCTGRGCTAEGETRILHEWELNEMDRDAEAHGDGPRPPIPVTLDLSRGPSELAPCVLCGVPCDALTVHVHPRCVDDEASALALVAVLNANAAPARRQERPSPTPGAPQPDPSTTSATPQRDARDHASARNHDDTSHAESPETRDPKLAQIILDAFPTGGDLCDPESALVCRLRVLFEDPQMRVVLVYYARRLAYVATRLRPVLARSIPGRAPLHFYRTDAPTQVWFCVSRADQYEPGVSSGVPQLDAVVMSATWAAHYFTMASANDLPAQKDHWTVDILHGDGETRGCLLGRHRAMNDTQLSFVALDFLRVLFADQRVRAVRLHPGEIPFVATRDPLTPEPAAPENVGREVSARYFSAQLTVAFHEVEGHVVPWFWVYRTDVFAPGFSTGSELDDLIRR